MALKRPPVSAAPGLRHIIRLSRLSANAKPYRDVRDPRRANPMSAAQIRYKTNAGGSKTTRLTEDPTRDASASQMPKAAASLKRSLRDMGSVPTAIAPTPLSMLAVSRAQKICI